MNPARRCGKGDKQKYKSVCMCVWELDKGKGEGTRREVGSSSSSNNNKNNDNGEAAQCARYTHREPSAVLPATTVASWAAAATGSVTVVVCRRRVSWL